MSRELSAFPNWPSLKVCKEDGWCRVHGEHDTHLRLQIAEVIRFLLGLLCVVGWLYWIGGELGGAGFVLIPATAFLIYPKSPLILCLTFFPKETDIVMERDSITLNGKTYGIAPHVDVQFRAGAKYLDERKEQRVRRIGRNGMLTPMTLHKVGYRKVEMIYGGNVIQVAVISDEDKAGHFAYVLQEAWNLSRTFEFPEEEKNVRHDILE